MSILQHLFVRSHSSRTFHRLPIVSPMVQGCPSDGRSRTPQCLHLSKKMNSHLLLTVVCS